MKGDRKNRTKCGFSNVIAGCSADDSVVQSEGKEVSWDCKEFMLHLRAEEGDTVVATKVKEI